MNHKVVIASDSTSDLNAELIEKYGVRIMPLTVNLGGCVFRDGVDIDPDTIYRHYEEKKELPKTASPNLSALCDFFAELTADGSEVVFFSISQEMSSTYNNARLAAAEHANVYTVDTRNLSTGGGLLVVAAGEMAAAGMGAAEIAKACCEMTALVDASFVVDDLEFLYKGGRCSAVAAIGAGLLQLKPCIVVKDGKMAVGKKYRGKFRAVLEKYVADRIGDGQGVDPARVFVTHAGVEREIVEQCVEQLRAMELFSEIHVTRAGCTISSHCGRNTLGVLFMHSKA